MKKALLAALCLMIALGTAIWPNTRAAAEAPESKVVRVGWYESTFCYHDQFGRRCGVDYEYMQKITAYTGWTVEYVEDSWPNLLQMLIRGDIDILSDVSYTEERSELILYPDLPMGSESYYLYIDADNASISSDNLASLNGKKIGVNKGSVQAAYLREWTERNGLTAEIVELTGEEADSMEMLFRGEIDGYVSMNSFGAKERIVPVFRIGASDYYYAVNKKRPDLLSDLNSALTGIQTEDPYFNQRMQDQHIQITQTNSFLTPGQDEWLEQHGTIRVGYRDNYLPFCTSDPKTGRLTGALQTYLAHAENCLKNAKIKFEAVPYPTTEEAIAAMQNGEVDCVFPVYLSSSDAEEMGVRVTSSVMSTEVYAIVRPSDLYGLPKDQEMTAAVISGSLNTDTFRKAYFPEWKILACPDAEACMQAVASGEADCLLTNSHRAAESEDRRSELKLVSIPTGEDMDFSFAVRRSDRQLYFILDKTAILTQHSDMESALASFAHLNRKTTFSQFIRDNWAAVIAIIVVIFAVILLLFWLELRAARKAHRQQKELRAAMQMAYTDPLTRVKNKLAYTEAEAEINLKITHKEISEFGIVVFDLNDLKVINDTQGHEAGDQYILDSCRLICGLYTHSPVFRIGGDEFAVILQGQDYDRRDELYRNFEKAVDENVQNGSPIVISSGMAIYDKGPDRSVEMVFERADENMYLRKKALKEKAKPIGKQERKDT